MFSDEIDSMVELILTVIMMAFGAMLASLSLVSLTNKVQLLERVDKVTIDREQITENYPFVYTGYQAYMFAWHMDEYSYVPLTWASYRNQTDFDATTGYMKDDSNSSKQITLGTLDFDGNHRNAFLVWRNRRIVGSGYASNNSVRKIVNSFEKSNDQNNDLYSLYKGFDDRRFILELEGNNWNRQYTNHGKLNLGFYSKGAKNAWVLQPLK